MVFRLTPFVLIVACTLAAGASDSQDPLGPRPKRHRTPEDYQPRTLREIAAASEAESSAHREDAEVVLGDLFPSRVRLIYKGSRRPIPQRRKAVILGWAQRYAGDPGHYAGPYSTEMLFAGEGKSQWLAVNKQLLPRFAAELKKGEPVDLYVIRLGGIRTGGKLELVLLVETFAKAKTVAR